MGVKGRAEAVPEADRPELRVGGGAGTGATARMGADGEPASTAESSAQLSCRRFFSTWASRTGRRGSRRPGGLLRPNWPSTRLQTSTPPTPRPLPDHASRGAPTSISPRPKPATVSEPSPGLASLGSPGHAHPRPAPHRPGSFLHPPHSHLADHPPSRRSRAPPPSTVPVAPSCSPKTPPKTGLLPSLSLPEAFGPPIPDRLSLYPLVNLTNQLGLPTFRPWQRRP